MQFNISINQKAFQEVAPECDIIDAAIFDFIHNYIASGKTETFKTDDGESWFWVSYQKIIDDNPILGINSKSPIYKRMDKMVEAGIFKRYPKNQEIAKTYFGRGENYDNLLYNRPTVKKNDPPSDKNAPSVSRERPPRSQKNDNYSTNNHSTNHSKTAREPTLPEKIEQCETVKALSDIWFNYRKEKNKFPGLSEQEMLRHQMSQWGLSKSKKIVKKAITNGWLSLKEDYISDNEHTGLGDNNKLRKLSKQQ